MRCEADFPGEPKTIGDLMTSPNPARDEAVAPDVLAKQVADAASDMCEIARIVGEWRHGPKQSLTAVREIRACLAAKPPAIGVDAVVEAMENDPFWQDAPLAGTTEQDQRIRHYAEVALASLSPAATSGSEAGGEAPSCYNTGLRCLAGCDGRTCAGANVPLNQWPEPALAKPASSPAGGDVDGTAQIALGHFKTTTERAQQITKLEGALQRCVEALAPHALDDRVAAQARAIGLAALSPSTSAAEPVVWMIQYENGCRSFYLCEQLALPSGHKQTPLYATPPATAAVDGQRVKVRDWLAVARAAGQHGVRYRTNRALEAFLSEIRACLAADKEGA